MQPDLTIKPAAAFLGIRVDSLLNAARAGWVECEWREHNGQQVRMFRRDVLEAYREKQRAKAQARLATLAGVAG